MGGLLSRPSRTTEEIAAEKRKERGNLDNFRPNDKYSRENEEHRQRKKDEELRKQRQIQIQEREEHRRRMEAGRLNREKQRREIEQNKQKQQETVTPTTTTRRQDEDAERTKVIVPEQLRRDIVSPSSHQQRTENDQQGGATKTRPRDRGVPETRNTPSPHLSPSDETPTTSVHPDRKENLGTPPTPQDHTSVQRLEEPDKQKKQGSSSHSTLTPEQIVKKSEERGNLHIIEHQQEIRDEALVNEDQQQISKEKMHKAKVHKRGQREAHHEQDDMSQGVMEDEDIVPQQQTQDIVSPSRHQQRTEIDKHKKGHPREPHSNPVQRDPKKKFPRNKGALKPNKGHAHHLSPPVKGVPTPSFYPNKDEQLSTPSSSDQKDHSSVQRLVESDQQK